MPVLRFKAEDVRRVVEHSIAAPRQSDVAYTTKPVEAPAVLLVHEQGVYLMSNGKPRDIVGADATDRKDAAKDEGRSFCAYPSAAIRRRTQTGTRPRAVWSAAATSSRRCHGRAS